MTEPEPSPRAPVRPRRRLRLLTAAAGLAAACALGLLLFRGPGGDGGGVVMGELTYEVKRGDLRISFTERGNVKALKSVPIYCTLEGSHTIVSLIPEGTNVNAGDVLVELDASDLTQQLNQQQIQVETAEADLENASEQLEIQRSLGESQIEKSTLDLTLAEIDLEKYLSPRGDYELARTKANADKTIAEEELSRAQNELEWTEKLAAKGYVSGTELIADRLAVSKARLQLEQAGGALDLLERYTLKKDKAKYESSVTQAKQALDRAKREARAELAQAEATKRGKEATLNLSQRRLAKLQDQLEKTKVRAPGDGMVVYPNVEPWRRERMIMQGADVHENQLLMNLPDVSVMAVDVQVHESWVDQVKEGLPALVSIDALPNLQLRGKVSRVGLLPDSVNRWINPDLKVYQTEVTLEESQDVSLLRPGMSAKVEVLIAVLRDVVYVPVQSVSSIDDRQVCYALEGGELVPRTIQGGRYNESFVEVASGLKEGDVIQLTAPAPRGMRKLEREPIDEALAAELEAAASGEGGPSDKGVPGGPGGPGERRGPRGKGEGRKKPGDLDGREAGGAGRPGAEEAGYARRRRGPEAEGSPRPASHREEGGAPRGAPPPGPPALKAGAAPAGGVRPAEPASGASGGGGQ
ncbi:MAG: HlyD family efflux transporter periplasmic adaptor subunit [Planctomycetes bacterium]|nr:HlyD family efflux transporter periplasmic adaptor subunit [Planctomycetota bacterium]